MFDIAKNEYFTFCTFKERHKNIWKERRIEEGSPPHVGDIDNVQFTLITGKTITHKNCKLS